LDYIFVADSVGQSSTMFTKLDPKSAAFGRTTQNNGYYAIQGHSRSPILVPMVSPYTTSYWWLILTYILSLIVSKLLQIIRQICAFDGVYLSLTHWFGVNP